MSSLPFQWHGLDLHARPAGALWWPEGRWLIVADLHLGKSERMARRGGALLPPYEGLATLERLQTEIEATDPAVIISLGDGFDDDAAATGLGSAECAKLHQLARGREWLWLAGNHDPGASPCTHLPGRFGAEARLGGAVLRHKAGHEPDISGHYHPVVRITGKRVRAFLIGADHLILPAFGAYTGGLDTGHPTLAALTSGGVAVACLHRAIPLPLGSRATG